MNVLHFSFITLLLILCKCDEITQAETPHTDTSTLSGGDGIKTDADNKRQNSKPDLNPVDFCILLRVN